MGLFIQHGPQSVLKLHQPNLGHGGYEHIRHILEIFVQLNSHFRNKLLVQHIGFGDGYQSVLVQ